MWTERTIAGRLYRARMNKLGRAQGTDLTQAGLDIESDRGGRWAAVRWLQRRDDVLVLIGGNR